jgi:hypothetical protein
LSSRLEIMAGGQCLLGGLPLHPAAGPLEAAAGEVMQSLQHTGPKDTVVIAGCGLGWHARALLDLPAPPNLIIYDPDPQSFDLMKQKGPRLDGALLARNQMELAALLAQRVVYDNAGWVSVYCHPAYRKALPHLAQEAQRLVEETVLRGQVDRTTRSSKKTLWLQNLTINFKQMLTLPDLATLPGVMRGAPAIVAGAGPSLDRDLPQLARARDQALILAAASVLGPLAQSGRTPHLALALEGKDESRQFIPGGQKGCLLAAASNSHPNHFQAWQGRKGLFHLFPWLAGLAGLGPHVPSGGHATSAAFSLAVLWGCDPIILVGQDLAYTGGRMHASARPGGEDYERPQTLPVKALDGSEAETSVAMHSYITWYKEAVAYLNTLPHPPRLINATTSGARLDGFEERPLGALLDSLPPLGSGFTELLDNLERITRPSASLLAARLAKARAGIKKAAMLLDEKGLDICRKQLPPNSAASFALDDLLPGSEPEAARQRLDEMYQALDHMSETLYA